MIRPISSSAQVLLVLSLAVPSATQVAGQDGPTLWTTAAALAPGFGFWVRPGKWGANEPLGETSRYKTSAIGTGTLTWVADFPQTGSYQVWVRHFGFRGTVQVDERPVTDGRGGPAVGGGYVWWHLGEMAIEKGPAHVDIVVEQAAVDAVLFTLNEDFEPEAGPLPERVKEPVLRAVRRYRDDAHLRPPAGAARLVAGQMADPYEEHRNDLVPARSELLKTLRIWGSPNQYVTGTFCLRALENAGDLTISLAGLAGPGRQVNQRSIDLRVAHLRERSIAAHSEHTAFSGKGVLPDLLLRDDRTGMPPTGRQGGYGGGRCVTAIPAHESRQIWLTVRVPGRCPPGEYRGSLDIQVKGAPERALSIPVALEVLPLDLQPVEGYYGSFFRASIDPTTEGSISTKRFLSELRCHVRYGLNAVTLYDGAPMLRYARKAGMTQPPVSMNPRTTGALGSWEDEALNQVAAAKAMGFPDLYFYGVDEPHTDEAIALARSAGQRAAEIGIHAQESFMGPGDYEKLKDVTSRPVMMVYNFNLSGVRNEGVEYARQRGCRPISYWFTSTSYPLHHRSLAGLYNAAGGYCGTAPWATQDYGGGSPDGGYWVYYPDARGEPIPTIRFEALRHGIDDVRYLQALDRALAAAESKLDRQPKNAALQEALAEARQVRRTRFESIDGGYVAYISNSSGGALDGARREMAEATIALHECLPE